MLPLKNDPEKTADYIQELCTELSRVTIRSDRILSKWFQDHLRLSMENEGIQYHAFFNFKSLQRIYSGLVEEFQKSLAQSKRVSCAITPVSSTSEELGNFVLDFVQRQFDASRLFVRTVEQTKKRINDKYENIKDAIEGVSNGEDLFSFTCWECGTDGSVVKRCSRCSAARYCSSECQRKSWKEGHKEHCDELKGLYVRFRTNTRCISDTIRHGLEGTNLTPHYGRLFSLGWCAAEYNHLVPTLLSTDSYSINLVERGFRRPSGSIIDLSDCGIKGPSMNIFFTNVNYILCGGDHWLFGDTPIVDFAAPCELVPGGNTLRTASVISLFLSYDCSEADTSSTGFEVFVQLGLCMKAECEESDEIPFTARKFLGMLFPGSIGMDDPAGTLRVARTSVMRAAHQTMRAKYHTNMA